MKLTFLGTGTSQGIPQIGCTCEVCKSISFQDKRLRTSAWISHSDKHFIIDTGPDFRQQALRHKISRVDAVLYTHPHRDHTAGMDELRSFNFMQHEPINVYANDMTVRRLHDDFQYAFSRPKYPGAPEIETHVIHNEPFTVEGVVIIPIHVIHGKIPVFGYRIGDVAYITDANHIPEAEFEKLKDLKVLVLNALQRTEHHSHFTLEEAIDIAKKIKADQTYFTHISHKMGLHREVSESLPDNILLAHDGLEVTLPDA